VDVHSHVVEEGPTVEQRLRQALEVLPKESIWVDPDCGLKTRTVDEAIAKMKTVVSAAKALRN
jgi:5-methyltetrahydropteroyltriglutamate--homocysteine methyltransferase